MLLFGLQPVQHLIQQHIGNGEVLDHVLIVVLQVNLEGMIRMLQAKLGGNVDGEQAGAAAELKGWGRKVGVK